MESNPGLNVLASDKHFHNRERLLSAVFAGIRFIDFPSILLLLTLYSMNFNLFIIAARLRVDAHRNHHIYNPVRHIVSSRNAESVISRGSITF